MLAGRRRVWSRGRDDGVDIGVVDKPYELHVWIRCLIVIPTPCRNVFMISPLRKKRPITLANAVKTGLTS